MVARYFSEHIILTVLMKWVLRHWETKAKLKLLYYNRGKRIHLTRQKKSLSCHQGQFHTKLLENSFTIMESVNEMTRSRIEFIIELVSLEVSCWKKLNPSSRIDRAANINSDEGYTQSKKDLRKLINFCLQWMLHVILSYSRSPYQ